MADLNKIKLARLLSSSMFWLAVIVIYLEYRGFTLQIVFQIIAYYSFLIVMFEYPTGVIGDYFSHKRSVILGYISAFVQYFTTLTDIVNKHISYSLYHFM